MLMCYFVSCAAFVCRHFPMMQCAFWPLLSQPHGGARFVKRANCCTAIVWVPNIPSIHTVLQTCGIRHCLSHMQSFQYTSFFYLAIQNSVGKYQLLLSDNYFLSLKPTIFYLSWLQSCDFTSCHYGHYRLRSLCQVRHVFLMIIRKT